AVRVLRRTFTFVAGRVDPLIVPLPAGCRFQLGFDLSEFVDEDPAWAGRLFLPGSYRAAVEFAGKAVTREETNSDTPGLAVMHYWTGTVRSRDGNLVLPVAPEGSEGEKEP